ncbi:hypothetical protein [Kutzneria kofuensis]|uniref:Molecular chaperone GrpE (Heat shock protein) n=1 Tax=Kutzneria kofuensis TaxID=103725 RepID=A0A7W9KQN6_9PSEU|nr:hypothetical protein [Kutzneria kofuensis]MBB5896658.1 molecular chaperone GrpE (heat shock protein) [Kutzneria kofuensis]
MSSSADAVGLDWSAFHPRPVGKPVELQSPASELGAALQRCRRDLTAERAASAEAAASARAEAAEQAALVFRLSAVLQEHDQAMVDAGLKRTSRTLRVVCDQMLSALDRAGLTVVDPVGQPFRDVAAAVEVVGWRHGPDFHDEVVAETVEPIIRHGAEVVRLGRVVMGEPAQGHSSDEEGA